MPLYNSGQSFFCILFIIKVEIKNLHRKGNKSKVTNSTAEKISDEIKQAMLCMTEDIKQNTVRGEYLHEVIYSL